MRPIKFKKVTLESVVGGKTIAEQSILPGEEPYLFNVATRLRAGGTFDHPKTGRRHVVLAMIADPDTKTLVVKIDGADFTSSHADEIGNIQPGTVVETTVAHKRLRVLERSVESGNVRCLNLTTNGEEELHPNWPVYEVLSPS